MLLSFAILHTNVQLKKVDALVLRLEEKEKKREKTSRNNPDVE
jgi:hypothetical protein